jgi:pyruvate,water dikinase
MKNMPPAKEIDIYKFADLPVGKWSQAGGKGAALARFYQAGYPVPDGFVILPRAFSGDTLTPQAWEGVKGHLKRMRAAHPKIAFAVRSSALSEDSLQASFAGEFETVLDVHSDEMIHAAIHEVHRSRDSERVRAYNQAKKIKASHDMAVVVQQLIRADISGVLFTADPVSGERGVMIGNFVYGFGEELVSGESEPYTFTLAHPKGKYAGPADLKRHGVKLYRLARKLEDDLDNAQDIEWAIANGKLYLLQSRPITTLTEHNPTTGEWNTSLTGDYLWSNANLMEAVPDVMTPLTWSIWQIFHLQNAIPIQNYPLVGNIAGRPYGNISYGVSLYVALGQDVDKALKNIEETLGKVPQGMHVPLLPMSRWEVLVSILPGIASRLVKYRGYVKKMPDFVENSPHECQVMKERIHQTGTNNGLITIWQDTLKPYFREITWMLRFSAKPAFEITRNLHNDLVKLVGEEDANALLSNLGGGKALASLAPMAALEDVAQGSLSRNEYLRLYGHRSPHEMELSIPHPSEDPTWLEEQIVTFQQSPYDVDAMLAEQRLSYDAAWKRLQELYPDKVPSFEKRIEKASQAAQMREAVRSEFTRFAGVLRAFAIRAGMLTRLTDGVFFLSIEELLDVLAGDDSPTINIPSRRETHTRYCQLPHLPALINGRFDPIQWVKDPNRRSDYYDAHESYIAEDSDILTGFPGAAGQVEGVVRRLDRVEDGDQLQHGEILVTTTTNVGWTPLFPRAGAVVTDVGAPLSHAAIVARELGIPAVVGCGNAKMRLCTGDRVRVDGGKGVVQILK